MLKGEIVMKKIFIIFTLVLLMFTVSCDDYMEDLLSQAKLTEGLAAYWPVTESYTSSTSYGKSIKDYSGNNNDLKAWEQMGGPTSLSCVPGVFSTALSFDGSNDYAYQNILNLLKGSNEVSVAYWIKNVTGGIIPSVYTPGFRMYHDGSYLSFTISNGVTSDEAWYNSFSSANWTYIVGTYDKEKIKLYVNGDLVAERVCSLNLSTSSGIYLCQDGSNTQFLSAVMDEIRIYNRALNQEEIEALMDMGVD